jgi:hypothetical protein
MLKTLLFTFAQVATFPSQHLVGSVSQHLCLKPTETEKRKNPAPNHLRKISKRCWLASSTKSSRLLGEQNVSTRSFASNFTFLLSGFNYGIKFAFFYFFRKSEGIIKAKEGRQKEARHVAHGTPQIVTSTPGDGNKKRNPKNISCD